MNSKLVMLIGLAILMTGCAAGAPGNVQNAPACVAQMTAECVQKAGVPDQATAEGCAISAATYCAANGNVPVASVPAATPSPVPSK